MDEQRVTLDTLKDELRLIVDGWKTIEQGDVPYRQLTPWEEERLGFARELLKQADRQQDEWVVVFHPTNWLIYHPTVLAGSWSEALNKGKAKLAEEYPDMPTYKVIGAWKLGSEHGGARNRTGIG